MNKFSTTTILKRSTLKTLCFVLIVLSSIVGCKKDKESINNISFTKYSLEETSCYWENLNYDEKVIAINSNEELENYIKCMESNHPVIDFTTHTLLLVSGKTDSKITEIIVKDLLQISSNKYKLNIKITMNIDATGESKWVIALVVRKLSEDCKIALNITTYYENGGDDFSLPRDKYIGGWLCMDADGAGYYATISSDSSNSTRVIIGNFFNLKGSVTAIVTDETINVPNQKMQDVPAIYWCEGNGILTKKNEAYIIYWSKYSVNDEETTSTYTKQ